MHKYHFGHFFGVISITKRVEILLLAVLLCVVAFTKVWLSVSGGNIDFPKVQIRQLALHHITGIAVPPVEGCHSL